MSANSKTGMFNSDSDLLLEQKISKQMKYSAELSSSLLPAFQHIMP